MKLNNKDYFLLYRLHVKHFHLCANGRQGKIVHKASQNIPYLDIKSHCLLPVLEKCCAHRRCFKIDFHRSFISFFLLMETSMDEADNENNKKHQ